jgi:quercetin dioxygenase-like cupin family protein
LQNEQCDSLARSRKGADMHTTITLPQTIGTTKVREVQTLFADQWRKLVLISLRQDALLADHSARVPITVHCLIGAGTLHVGNVAYTLTPGVIVPVDAHVVHNVQADPDLAILVTFFRQPENAGEPDTTARFA